MMSPPPLAWLAALALKALRSKGPVLRGLDASDSWYAAEPALLAKADPRACPAALPKLGKNIAEIY